MKKLKLEEIYSAVTKQMSEQKVVLASVVGGSHSLSLNWYPGQLSFGVEFDGKEERTSYLEDAVSNFHKKQW
jgi:hypothetical protein